MKLPRATLASHAVTFFVKNILKNRLRRCPEEWIGGVPVRKITLLLAIVSGFVVAISASAAKTEKLNFKPQFDFKDRNGNTVSAPVLDEYQMKKIVDHAAID